MDPLSKFGEFIVAQLRDSVIESAELTLNSHWKAPALLPLQEELAKLSEEQRSLIRRLVVNSIDYGIHNLLFQLDNMCEESGDIRIMVQGQDIAKLSGWLNAESFTEEGWNARFSKFGEAPDPA